MVSTHSLLILLSSSIALTAAQATSTLKVATATTAVSSASSCFDGYAATPLASKHFSYPDGIPYMVDTDTNTCRGHQIGYNICNSTTEGPDSLCQTAFINSIDDFCLWAPPTKGDVADLEGEMVAWCTKPGRGTRIIPEGALQGVQFLRAPAYVEVVGYIDQTLLNMAADDSGGEMDPHGADGKGNPMGGLFYSQAFGGNISDNSAWTQVIEWHNFMGGNQFCLKACDPAGADAANYCQHIYDRIGCQYNAPAAYVKGVFESCDSDNQEFPGVYVGADGRTSTYTQPPESDGVIETMPYTVAIPSSSQCTTYTSAALYTELEKGFKATSSASSASSAPSSSSASSSSVAGSTNETSTSSSVIAHITSSIFQSTSTAHAIAADAAGAAKSANTSSSSSTLTTSTSDAFPKTKAAVLPMAGLAAIYIALSGLL